jgi:hypothetical protein
MKETLRKLIIILILILSSSNLIGQNLNGKYVIKSELNGIDYDYGILELEIKSDSTFTITEYLGSKSDLNSYLNWRKKSRNGTIKKKLEKKYLLTEFVEGVKELEVKITRIKIIIYTYNSDFKKVKGMVLKKSSL